MKRTFFKLPVIALIIFALPQITGAQWIRTGESIDSYVYTLLISGKNIYAGTYKHGVYLSKDNGETWEMINSGLTYKFQDIDIEVLLAKGDHIFAGSYSSGIFRTSDGGKSWSIMDSQIVQIASIASNDNNIFLGTYNNGIYVSSDNGTTWAHIDGLSESSVFSLAASQNNIFAGSYHNGVFYSSNNGGQWTAVNGNFPENPMFDNIRTHPMVNSLIIKNSSIFAATDGYGIIYSSDNGKNWTAVNDGLTDRLVNVLLVSDSIIYAGTERNGVFCSNNNGSTWNSIGSGFPDFPVYSIAIKDSSIFVGTWGGGIWRMNRLKDPIKKYQSSKINTCSQITRSEYFNLRGQKLSMNNSNRIATKNKIIIMRYFDKNGRIVNVLKCVNCKLGSMESAQRNP